MFWLEGAKLVNPRVPGALYQSPNTVKLGFWASFVCYLRGLAPSKLLPEQVRA